MTGGLYTMWRPYIKQLSLVLGFMCQQIVVRRAAVVFANSGEGLDAGNAPFMYRFFSLLYRVLLRALEYSPFSHGGHIVPGDQKSFVLPR